MNRRLRSTMAAEPANRPSPPPLRRTGGSVSGTLVATTATITNPSAPTSQNDTRHCENCRIAAPSSGPTTGAIPPIGRGIDPAMALRDRAVRCDQDQIVDGHLPERDAVAREPRVIDVRESRLCCATSATPCA